MSLLNETLRAARQLPEPEMRAPLIKGVLTTLAAIVAIAIALGMLAGILSGGLALLGIGLGGLGFFGLAWYAFIPATALAVGFFVDPVADAVEARYFADAPPARKRPLMVDLTLTPKFVALALLINLPLVPFYWLFPPLPAAINGYLLGREFFELVARRRHSARELPAMRRSVRTSMWLVGGLLAFLVTIPFLNLLAPVFGMALMTHVYHRARRAA